MSDTCSDGRVKMQHILHTLKNMILFFKENQSLKVYITISAFDDKIYNIVERTLVTLETYSRIISAIDIIEPRGSTNIENALIDTKNQVDKLKEKYPTHNYYHIFMTDGQVTSGNSNNQALRNYVDDTITNAFIGFGIDHDSALLNTISEGENNANYFIDKLENAGLVYGEILHGFIYKFLENVEISVTNGLIYNFKTNNWNSTLRVGNVVSESSKFYHLVSSTPSECQVKISGKQINADKSDFSIDIQGSSDISDDLGKYIYRQRTQQLLYKVNDFIKKESSSKRINTWDEAQHLKEDKSALKTELRELFEELKKYMLDNDQKDDILLKNLCDDIYICYRTFGTHLAEMYCGARMCSQGSQRAYTATKLPDDEIEIEPFRIYRRQNACNTQMDDSDSDSDCEENKNNNIYIPELRHDISDSIDTPYCTPTISRLMRSVSAKVKVDEEETLVIH
jgi:hypothetical protein